MVFTQHDYQALAGEIPTILVDASTTHAAAKNPADQPSPSTAQPSDLAYVLYTSGTTGTPKGVSVENRNVCSYIEAFRAEFDPRPGDRMLQHSVCSFDIFVEEVFSTLLSGSTLVIAPKAVKEDIARLIDFIDDHSVTIVDVDGTRHYRSGDMGFVREDGNLIFLHRKDDQVMIGGKRVEAKEVENVLLQQSSVHQAVVVPGRDEAGFSYLTAYIVPATAEFSLAELRRDLAQHLTTFMIPENGTCAYLMNIYTRDEFRKHGIARAVVSWLIEKACERGIGKIYLESTAAGRPLYEGMGFKDMQGMMKLS